MRVYKHQHRFYCGIDLHARTLYLHVLDHDGKTHLEKNIVARPDTFLEAIQPFRDGLVVGAECMFAWYWLADLCQAEGITFVLGHALYMRMIHGGKSKNDKIDAAKIAGLLRGGLFPQAYVYPAALRETRDLLRRRTFLVQQRAQYLTHARVVNCSACGAARSEGADRCAYCQAQFTLHARIAVGCRRRLHPAAESG